jgi:hypothetical protein
MRHSEGEVAVVAVVAVDSLDLDGKPRVIGNLAYDGE